MMEELKKVVAPLNQPLKRAGFVVLIIGTFLTLIGWIQIGSDLYSYRWFEKFIGKFGDALIFDRYTYRRYPLASIGPYVMLAGLLLSYLYDRTIGRILTWIRHG